MPPSLAHGFANLGGAVLPIDKHDIPLGRAQAPVTPPPVFMQDKAFAVPIEYQGMQPACGAHAGAWLKAYLDARFGAHYTPRFTWADVKTFDGLPLDVGTDMRSIFKSLQNTGALDFAMLGNDVGLSENDYAHPLLTPGMEQAAHNIRIGLYAFVDDMSWDGLRRAIFQNGAVLIRVEVGKEWWTAPNGTTSWNEKDILPLRPISDVVSGHFVVAHSYDEQNIYFANSWSLGWGKLGHGYFGQNYMPFVTNGGTAVDLLFSKNLFYGMTDPDVLRLQKVLNANPQTQIAQSGMGAPGNETNFFGVLTKAAVIKFQQLHGIAPAAGFVGPLTRAVLNTV